jgi:hypothetical protein
MHPLAHAAHLGEGYTHYVVRGHHRPAGHCWHYRTQASTQRARSAMHGLALRCVPVLSVGQVMAIWLTGNMKLTRS